jgi:hypothetical protein
MNCAFLSNKPFIRKFRKRSTTMNDDQASPLTLAAQDVLTEAAEILAEGHQALGCWLLTEPLVEQLKTTDDATPPRATKREQASTDEITFVEACGICTTTVLNSMPQEERLAINGALSRGSHLRVYARPDSREVAIVLADKAGKRVELARHVVTATEH